ncbi:glutamine amidotransferase [Defluviimonas sp. 20V17]|uniref:GMP synthase (Glutamine-hydrolysing) n=1 Tax=Allgaiera indica TaxID=765699 RepID=A0AAN4UQ49_9RHOB|nr:type 1 glutamine amidotransferase [Allgaiera indica]KDB03770.1 glutamine amidotransferase [Defluviimonas sp. 20V17]GHD99971.1 glutamine amidotransferase [Allgaiera indica]SDW39648.1 GMP synthase (glutamine-hydrolysing) [Allgaiera indica]
MLIGILQTGEAPEALRGQSGDYPTMFERLLAGHGFTFRTWRVIDMDFPEGPGAADGWLITGSRHGAYEDHPWIAPLEDFIRAVQAARVPMVGICFGHQIIAQALGGKVEKFPGGWAVGPQDYDFQGRKLTLNAWHQDQVTRAPQGARQVGSSPFCANAALAYGDTIWTVQPHPEFRDDFVKGLIETRGPGVVPAPQLAEAAARLGTPIDDLSMARDIAAFFTQARAAA